jgi:ligand-binding SRPBCC domain-containing protein
MAISQTFSPQRTQRKKELFFTSRCWRFETRDGGTLISDTINLALPLGLLGQLAYKIKVQSDVREIFAFREKKVHALFG